MRAPLDPRLTKGRVRSGTWASDDSYGANGAFFVAGPCGADLKIIASDGTLIGPDDPIEAASWEHVSVSCRNRCPNWPEMSFVKSLFWGDDECVVEFHPPRSEYINCHPYCLHLWRHRTAVFPMPPSIMVGLNSIEDSVKAVGGVVIGRRA